MSVDLRRYAEGSTVAEHLLQDGDRHINDDNEKSPGYNHAVPSEIQSLEIIVNSINFNLEDGYKLGNTWMELNLNLNETFSGITWTGHVGTAADIALAS